MSDALTTCTVVLSFAVLVTAHVSIVAGLLARPPRWRAPVGLIAAPLAPYWAAREGMWIRALAWGLGFAGYAFGRLMALA